MVVFNDFLVLLRIIDVLFVYCDIKYWVLLILIFVIFLLFLILIDNIFVYNKKM